MRLSLAARSLLALTLCHVCAAQAQVPFLEHAQGLANKAQDILQNGLSSEFYKDDAPRYAAPNVLPLTISNWKSVLTHSGKRAPYNPPEAWMVYITANNKTCRGYCDVIDPAWNESAALFANDISAPRLAQINCDTDEILCGAWAARVGTVWFILLPQPLPDQSPGSTDITIHYLNLTTTTSGDITKIHTRRKYIAEPKYESILHPFDGWIARYGLTHPMAYFLWGLSKVPGWMVMLVVLLFSRYWTGKYMPRPVPDSAGSNRPAAAAS